MKKKSMLSVSLVTVLCVSMLLGGCGKSDDTNDQQDSVESTVQESPEPSGEITMYDGYYQHTIEDMNMVNYIHFNEDGTWYCNYFSGAYTDAGEFRILDEEMEYSVDAGPDEDFNTVEDNGKATASQVVELTSYRTGEVQKVAFVDDQLCDMSLGGMANHRNMIHEPDYPYDPDKDEVAIQIYVFYAGSLGSSFTLSHNRTFEDVTGDTFEEGSWELTGNGEYALTYSDGGKGTLTVDASGKNATLKLPDGSELELKGTYGEEDGAVRLINTLRAEGAEVGLPMTVDLRIDCYSDGTCKLVMEIAQIGSELEVDQGTYTVDTTNYKYTFRFEQGGEIVSEPDYAGASESGLPMTVTYQHEAEAEFNGETSTFNIDAVFEGMVTGEEGETGSAEAEVVTTLTAEGSLVEELPMSITLRLDCYSDGTCGLIMEIAQTGDEIEADHGTYDVDTNTYKYTFQFDQAGEIAGEPDYANASESGLPMTVTYQFGPEVEFNGESSVFHIDAVLEGTITG